MTFIITLKPNADCRMEETPRVRRAEFEMGPRKLGSDQINTIQRKWNVAFSNLIKTEAIAFCGNLEVAGGVEPIQWQSPEDDGLRYYLAPTWQTRCLSGQVYEVTVTLEEWFGGEP